MLSTTFHESKAWSFTKAEAQLTIVGRGARAKKAYPSYIHYKSSLFLFCHRLSRQMHTTRDNYMNTIMHVL
jgi:hypothetical protein